MMDIGGKKDNEGSRGEEGLSFKPPENYSSFCPTSERVHGASPTFVRHVRIPNHTAIPMVSLSGSYSIPRSSGEYFEELMILHGRELSYQPYRSM